MNYNKMTKKDLIEENTELRRQLIAAGQQGSLAGGDSENQLIQFYQRYRSLIDKTNEAVYILQDAHFVFINRPLATLLGVPRKKLLGDTFYDYIWPGDKDQVVKNYWNRVNGKEAPDIYEFRVIGAGGKQTWVHLSATARLQWKGKEAILYTFTDITERKQTEELLRESEHKFRVLTEASPMAIMLHQNNKWVYLNPAAVRIPGYTAEELCGMNFWDIVHPDNKDIVIARGKAREKGETVADRYEIRIICKDGTIKWIDIAGATTSFMGQPAAILTAMDITGLKRAEIALRESERRYRSIFENSLLGIYQHALDGTRVCMNHAFAKMFGYKSPDEMASSIKDVAIQLYVNPKDRSRLKDVLIEKGVVENFEVEMRRRDGRIIWVSLSIWTIRDEEGEVLYYDGTALDITESKKATEMLRNSHDQMRTLAGRLRDVREEERKRIARAIHDEMGQALTGIKMDLAWVRQRITDQKEINIQKIKARLESTGDLVDVTIREMRRIITELRPGVLDDLGLIAAIEWLAQDLKARIGAECVFDPPDEEINVDPERDIVIFRITQEAITNVIRHARATKIRITLCVEQEDIALEIIDNGRGFSETKARRSGAYGLLGMEERALAIGGTVTIQSLRGIGTTVKVMIPLIFNSSRKIVS